MKVRVVSDLHLEFNYEDEASHLKLVPPQDEDAETVLIVAGDVCPIKYGERRIPTFFQGVSSRFKHVVYVLGNHEHYGWDFSSTIDAARELIAADNVSVFGSKVDEVTIEGVRFIGATLWTSMNAHPEIARVVESTLHDYHLVQLNSHHLYASDTIEAHLAAVDDLEKALVGRDNSKTIIVSHHLPTFQAVSPRFMKTSRDRIISHGFASNLDELIIRLKPRAWVFGHTHDPYFGSIGETELFCNPHGYPRELGNGFNPALGFHV
jgi:Icc-related predicted phosphoesterase